MPVPTDLLESGLCNHLLISLSHTFTHTHTHTHTFSGGTQVGLRDGVISTCSSSVILESDEEMRKVKRTKHVYTYLFLTRSQSVLPESP